MHQQLNMFVSMIAWKEEFAPEKIACFAPFFLFCVPPHTVNNTSFTSNSTLLLLDSFTLSGDGNCFL